MEIAINLIKEKHDVGYIIPTNSQHDLGVKNKLNLLSPMQDHENIPTPARVQL